MSNPLLELFKITSNYKSKLSISASELYVN